MRLLAASIRLAQTRAAMPGQNRPEHGRQIATQFFADLWFRVRPATDFMIYSEMPDRTTLDFGLRSVSTPNAARIIRHGSIGTE